MNWYTPKNISLSKEIYLCCTFLFCNRVVPIFRRAFLNSLGEKKYSTSSRHINWKWKWPNNKKVLNRTRQGICINIYGKNEPSRSNQFHLDSRRLYCTQISVRFEMRCLLAQHFFIKESASNLEGHHQYLSTSEEIAI